MVCTVDHHAARQTWRDGVYGIYLGTDGLDDTLSKCVKDAISGIEASSMGQGVWCIIILPPVSRKQERICLQCASLALYAMCTLVARSAAYRNLKHVN